MAVGIIITVVLGAIILIGGSADATPPQRDCGTVQDAGGRTHSACPSSSVPVSPSSVAASASKSSAAPSMSSSTSTSPSGSVVASSVGTVPSLPVTGAGVAGYILFGGLLLLFGLALYRLSRRRRVSFTP